MQISASGWARNCGQNTIANADIANTRYLMASLRGGDDATVMADASGTIRISIQKRKLILNGNYNVDLVLTRDEIVTLARMALSGQDFLQVARDLGKVEQAPVYATASA